MAIKLKDTQLPPLPSKTALVEMEARLADSLVPSPDFGACVRVVDHALLGSKMQQWRKSKKVKAIRLAEFLGVSKVIIAHLEFGRKNWTMQILKDYTRGVYVLLK